ncbi:MAG: 16S rRNA (cytidine(1402)-2'-O)-methyltransferase [Thiopseudomonas sp.]|nr:16S rRNA (cytidine(1402)-2'-O)-methyltransferase [Thiopseudomonas sp.]
MGNQNSGILYVVATPIGNLQDISARALQLLQQVDLIAAEDTRHSARLLEHFGIRTPMVACHEHNERDGSGALVERLLAGETLALISDAGTPLVSDPGFRLVRAARAAAVQVVPVPGACAAIAALSVAGLPSDRFSFEGFLPAKSAARSKRLQDLAGDSRTLIFYEAPHRVLECVMDMASAFGPLRKAVLARELTKAFETIHDAPLGELAAWIAADSNQQRGECVLLVEGADDKAERDVVDAESQRVLMLLAAELPLKKAAALTAQITGARKNLLYQWGLEQGR